MRSMQNTLHLVIFVEKTNLFRVCVCLWNVTGWGLVKIQDVPATLSSTPIFIQHQFWASRSFVFFGILGEIGSILWKLCEYLRERTLFLEVSSLSRGFIRGSFVLLQLGWRRTRNVMSFTYAVSAELGKSIMAILVHANTCLTGKKSQKRTSHCQRKSRVNHQKLAVCF